MTTLNIALLNKTLNAIVADPESWHQRDFLCGTQMCLAGHALIQSGQFTIKAKMFVRVDDVDDFHAVDPETDGAALLGLTGEQADHVFYLMPSAREEWLATVGTVDADPVAFAAYVRTYLGV
jgi:hypothetical protein